MKNRKIQQSAIARHLWLSLAVFFLLFCSTPVKKFIRMQLYRHTTFVTGNYPGAEFSRKDIKDCTIAERQDKDTEVFKIVFNAQPAAPIVFYVPALLIVLSFFFQNKDSQYPIAVSYFIPPPKRLYLKLKHLQV